MTSVRLWCGDALELAGRLGDRSVDCLVTSPPYFKAREYSADPRQLGGAYQSLDEYVDYLVALFRALLPKLERTPPVCCPCGRRQYQPDVVCGPELCPTWRDPDPIAPPFVPTEPTLDDEDLPDDRAVVEHRLDLVIALGQVAEGDDVDALVERAMQLETRIAALPRRTEQQEEAMMNIKTNDAGAPAIPPAPAPAAPSRGWTLVVTLYEYVRGDERRTPAALARAARHEADGSTIVKALETFFTEASNDLATIAPDADDA
jgi:hypothetical protein